MGSISGRAVRVGTLIRGKQLLHLFISQKTYIGFLMLRQRITEHDMRIP